MTPSSRLRWTLAAAAARAAGAAVPACIANGPPIDPITNEGGADEGDAGPDAPPDVPVSEPHAVVGATPLPRTEIISKLWVYIKAHNLQDAANKRMINADAKLKEVFGKPQVSMFEMAGLIGKHVK